MRTCTIAFLTALFIVSITSHAQQAPRGQTEAETFPSSFICIGDAERVEPARTRHIAAPLGKEAACAEDWHVADSVVFDSYVPAQGYTGIRFDRAGRRLELVSSLPRLTAAARTAVERSPHWVRADLEHTLSCLSDGRQDDLTMVINDAPEHLVDEIAFSIAHSSPAYLSSPFFQQELFRENAELIYAHDQLLRYVEVVDRGSLAAGDAYSTVRYWRVDKDSNRVQVEVPRDIYYWYIVHPKITDEISAYVDPASTDGASAIKPPPQGKFWRDHLFTVTDPVPDTTGVNYPILRDVVGACDVLWADRGTEKQAVLEVGKWIRDVLEFGSGSERPHQPVRIYTLHLGRCGEHADITAAAARACLIPCREVSAISSDHVWNEFWDEQWWQWEPVNNSQKNPLVYSEGWGKKFGTVMARRSDGVLHPVTDGYAKGTCTLEVRAQDANGAPVDGAVVMIAMRVDQSIYIDTYGATGSDGIARFILGKGNEYFARFDSPNAGCFPAQTSQVARLMTDAQPGQHYAYQIKSTVVKPQLVKEFGLVPMTDTLSDFGVEAEGTVLSQASRWQQPMDDINIVSKSVFFEEAGAGALDLSLIHRNEFPDLRDKKPYQSSGGVTAARDAVSLAAWNVDGTEDFYLLFINGSNANNPVRVNATVRLYFSSLINDVASSPAADAFSIVDCYPSPVTGGAANLTLAVPAGAGSRLTMELFDVLGRKVLTREVQLASPGRQSIRLDTRGLLHGAYLLRVHGQAGIRASRMMQIR